MKKIIVLCLGISLLAAACNRQLSSTYVYSDGTMKVGSKIIDIQVADTPALQEQGLSGRESIGEGQGMLFIFAESGYYSFWMKDMKFPIDIIWLRDTEIVDITYEAEPQPGIATSHLKHYTPKRHSNRVLELKAGWANRHGLKIGDKVEYNLKAK